MLPPCRQTADQAPKGGGEEAPATLQLKPAPLKEHYKDNYAIHSEKGSGAKAAEAAKRKRGHDRVSA